jgi:hypothetical protein
MTKLSTFSVGEEGIMYGLECSVLILCISIIFRMRWMLDVYDMYFVCIPFHT